jgi:hypothetical protein
MGRTRRRLQRQANGFSDLFLADPPRRFRARPIAKTVDPSPGEIGAPGPAAFPWSRRQSRAA